MAEVYEGAKKSPEATQWLVFRDKNIVWTQLSGKSLEGGRRKPATPDWNRTLVQGTSEEERMEEVDEEAK